MEPSYNLVANGNRNSNTWHFTRRDSSPAMALLRGAMKVGQLVTSAMFKPRSLLVLAPGFNSGF